jgi:hypothetical protein
VLILTKFFPYTLELFKVCLVLLLVLHLLPDTLKDTDGGSVVVHPTGGAEGSLANRRGGDQVMREAVVETALDFEQILRVLEEGDIALREGLEGLLAVVARRVTDLSELAERLRRARGGARAESGSEYASAHHEGQEWTGDTSGGRDSKERKEEVE